MTQTVSDSESLQKDLDSLAKWSQKWMLEFNSSKCKVMHVGHKLNTKYFMNDKHGNTELSAVQEEKDMGVEFYLCPTVGTVLIHSVKPELTE